MKKSIHLISWYSSSMVLRQPRVWTLILLATSKNWVVSSVYGADNKAARQSIQRLKRQLRDPLFTAADRSLAEEENATLLEAVGALEEAATFQARPEFVLDEAMGSAANQYRRAFNRVRESLESAANRANLRLDEGLGMPRLSPTREDEIVRYLEALDLVETVVELCIDARVDRLDRITVRLDPTLHSATGVDRIERTRVGFKMTASSLALSRVLAWSQRPPGGGRVLLVDELEMTPARSKEDEVTLEVTFLVARLNRVEEEPEG